MTAQPGVGDAGPRRTSDVHEVLRRLELTVARRLDGLLHGDYRGLVPGHGSDPGEARPYADGDDTRRIDWNVTARMLDPHVRDTVADRELEARVLVDLSPSISWGTATQTKRDLALSATAAVGFLTARLGNRFGLAAVGCRPTYELPARSGRTHLLAGLRRLAELEPDPDPGVDLAAGLTRMHATFRRRGLCAVVSDFLDTDDWGDGLRRLAVRHHVLCIELIDPRELELPDVGLVDLVDPETGRHVEVNTGDRRLRERYASAAADQRADVASTMRRAGAEHLVLRTDRDWVLDLARHVARRRHQVASTGAAT